MDQPTAPSTEELAATLRSLIARLARRLRQEAERAAEMTPTRFATLATIERTGAITLGDLAAAEQVQPPTMTRIVAYLEEAGLVAREVDSQDRRFVRVTVTPEGRALVHADRRRRDAFLAARIAAMSEDDRRTLIAALPVLTGLLSDGR